MKKAIIVFLSVVAVISAFAPYTVLAEESAKPIQLALFTPIQLVPEETAIRGVRISLLYSKNTAVNGLDLGFLVSHNTTGLSKGAQLAFVAINEADYVGFQGSTVNYNKMNFEGFQWGLVNYAGHANGFQLGFVNYAETMKGLQIGLVNIIKQGGAFPVFPIVNWSF